MPRWNLWVVPDTNAALKKRRNIMSENCTICPFTQYWYIFVALAVLLWAGMKFMDSKKKTVIVENSSVITLTSQNFKDTISFGVVMVDFWASWCGPCRKQSAIINETVDELPSGVIIGKVNVDEEKALAEEFNISSIPSWLVFKDGEKISSMTGVQSKEQLIKIASASK